MLKKITRFLTAVTLLILVFSFYHNFRSVQPPANHTGAPGDPTCAECHGNLNTGGGSVVVNGVPSTFLPGQTYLLSVTISHPTTRGRWGFEMDARNANNSPIGTFSTTNPNATLNGSPAEISHHNAVFSTGTTFTYDSLFWTAPSIINPGDSKVTFYVAGNAANGNGFPTGDFIYTNTAQSVTDSSWTFTGNSNASASAKLGTTNAVPLNLTTNNLTRIRIGTDGKVGIGTTSPLTPLHVVGFGSFGNRITTANAARALNLADTAAVVRVLRVDPANAPAVELISRTSADGANIAYWDFYAQPSDASFRIRDRQTGMNIDRVTISHATGNVGLGTVSPNATALLELSANNKGLLVPRMTQAQRNAIASPARGLLIFQTDSTAGFYYFDSGWKLLNSSVATLTTNALIPSDNASLQELKTGYQKLQEELAQLRQSIAELKADRFTDHNKDPAYLEQNSPNPFNSTTTIRYNLPLNTRAATMVITDINGVVIKTFALNNKNGTGQVTLNAGTLAAGTYNYSLYVDNRQADSKRLVIIQ